MHHDTASKWGTQVIGVFIIDFGRTDLQLGAYLDRDMVLVVADPDLGGFLALGKGVVVDVDIEMAGSVLQRLTYVQRSAARYSGN